MNTLPSDMRHRYLFLHLHLESIPVLAQVSREYRDICKTAATWRYVLRVREKIEYLGPRPFTLYRSIRWSGRDTVDNVLPSLTLTVPLLNELSSKVGLPILYVTKYNLTYKFRLSPKLRLKVQVCETPRVELLLEGGDLAILSSLVFSASIYLTSTSLTPYKINLVAREIAKYSTIKWVTLVNRELKRSLTFLGKSLDIDIGEIFRYTSYL